MLAANGSFSKETLTEKIGKYLGAPPAANYRVPLTPSSREHYGLAWVWGMVKVFRDGMVKGVRVSACAGWVGGETSGRIFFFF